MLIDDFWYYGNRINDCFYDCESMEVFIFNFLFCIDIGNKYLVYVVNEKGNFSVKIILNRVIIICEFWCVFIFIIKLFIILFLMI